MPVLRILAGGAAQSLVEKARPGFEAARGCTIDGTFSAVGAMRDRLLAGEPADIVILSRALVDELARSGHVVASTITDVARVATAVAVRSGDPLPAIGDKAGLRRGARGRRRDPFPRSGSRDRRHPLRQGDARARRLGPCRRPAEARAQRQHGDAGPRRLERRRIRSAARRRRKSAPTPGIVLVGPLPPGCDLTTVYTAAVTSTSGAPDEAARFIARASAP